MPELDDATRSFILHWGEMGTRWGINRTVAQIHALLFIAPEPMNAEEISATLHVSRSNVSTSLRELVGWRIVRTVQQLGDRRDYYEALGDVWEMARIIAEERKKREFDPTVTALRECIGTLDEAAPGSEEKRRKLTEMLAFMETVSDVYEQLRRVPTPALRKFAKLGSKIPRVIGGG
ncbi:MAG: hypothetical protein PWP23_468 [Candidatus Sumerlaeota bacterium]|nr:hypothetical protein [Candidatus Sumerlaeota bacterium]